MSTDVPDEAATNEGWPCVPNQAATDEAAVESVFKFIHRIGLRGEAATLAVDAVEARDRACIAAGREHGAKDEQHRWIRIAKSRNAQYVTVEELQDAIGRRARGDR